MKKYLVIIIICAANFVNAQMIKGYGFKVGMTSSLEKWNFNSELSNDFETNSRLGLNISGFLEMLDVPFIGIIAELGYTQKGMTEQLPLTLILDTDGSSGNKIKIDNRVDYLIFSLALKVNYPTPLVTPYFFAGPKLDLLLGSDVHPGYKSVYDDFEKTVYGLKLGIGSEIVNILPLSILAEFQYNYNLSDVYKTDFLKIENNSFEFKIGVIL